MQCRSFVEQLHSMIEMTSLLSSTAERTVASLASAMSEVGRLCCRFSALYSLQMLASHTYLPPTDSFDHLPPLGVLHKEATDHGSPVTLPGLQPQLLCLN